MKTLSFVIDGVPQGKGRPRAFRFGKGVRMYTPGGTERYESLVRDAFHLTYREATAPYEGPVSLVVRAYWPIPKSRPKRFREIAAAERLGVTKKPDWDNVGKIITDALNGVAYRDDAQVVRAVVEKFYSERPRVEVQIALGAESE